MVSHFINLEWKQFFRSSYWQKSIGLNILLVFVALYFMLTFLAIGFGLYPILKKEFPDSDPLNIVNNFLFYWFLGDLMLRFIMQKLPAMSVKPLLILPIKRNRIIHYVLCKSVLSFFNFLPLFAIIPFGTMHIIKENTFSTTSIWILSMMIFTLIINFLNFIIESYSSETELSFLPILLIVSGLFGLNYFNLVSFSSLLSTAMNTISNTPILIISLLVILGGLYYINYSVLKKKLFIDSGLKVRSQIASSSEMSWTKRFGDIAPFLQLDLKLLWRNKRSKSTIFLMVLALFYGLLFYPNPRYQDMAPMLIFVGVFITGIFMINFGQFIPAWDSGYYKLLMSQNIKYNDYLKSKFILMTISSIVLFILSIPYVYFGWKILLIHFAAMVYNVGINSHLLLFGGSFNRKKINLNQRAAFNYQGTGAVQWIIGFPLLFIPIILFYLPYKLINFEAGITTLIVMGLLGVVFHQRLMNFINKRYLKSKYEMIKAFEQEN